MRVKKRVSIMYCMQVNMLKSKTLQSNSAQVRGWGFVVVVVVVAFFSTEAVFCMIFFSQRISKNKPTNKKQNKNNTHAHTHKRISRTSAKSNKFFPFSHTDKSEPSKSISMLNVQGFLAT